MTPHRGATVWFTGLPSAGKSTLAAALAAYTPEGCAVEVLDGDELRAALSPRLGFTRADRDEHVGRVGHVARLLSRNGILTLVAVIAPYAAAREQVRERHLVDGVPFVLVHVATGLAECRRRDVSGLYAGHAAGRVRHLTGVDDPYEVPVDPDLVVGTEGRSVAECRDEVVAWLAARSLWPEGLDGSRAHP